jgi:anti-anti-sigma factor
MHQEQGAHIQSTRDDLAASLACTFVEGGHGHVVVCVGELDAATVPELRRSLAEGLRTAPYEVVVDLSKVPFFDCSAIGAFVDARAFLRSAGGDLTLHGTNPLGRRLLHIVGLADLEDRHPTTVLDAPPNPPDDAATLVEAWVATCATEVYRSSELVFADPAGVASALVALLDGPSPMLDPSTIARLLRVAGRTEEADATVAVLQVMALIAVTRSWISARVTPVRQEVRQRRLDHAGVALTLAVLEELESIGLIDPLTGLLNRRALDRDLPRVLTAARRHDQCLSVVMIDVEGLKATNDRFGHAAGDQTLRDVATNLSSALRAGDNAYRIGGDEFVLVLPDLCPEDVDGVMQRTVVGAKGAFTWGCAWVRGEPDSISDLDRAGRLVELADARMLAFRARREEGADRDSRRAAARASAMPADPAVELAGQLEVGSHGAVVIEQAKGVIAERFGLPIDQAAVILRLFAKDHQRSVISAAAGLINHTLDLDDFTTSRAAVSDLASCPADQP